METIVLSGVLDPLEAIDLRSKLVAATVDLRPIVMVDLTEVESVHVAAVAALIAATRRADDRGGELRLVLPESAAARAELDLRSWYPRPVVEGGEGS